jgi:hypothetical protein
MPRCRDHGQRGSWPGRSIPARFGAELNGCTCCKEHPMLDAIMLAIGLVFFALSVGYVVACDRL